MSLQSPDRDRRCRSVVWRPLVPAVLLTVATPCAFADDPPVEVVVDMDGAQPGVQSIVTVPACTTTVDRVAVYVTDPLAARLLWSIGYVGGIDRGIAFGHMPGAGVNHGSVSRMTAKPGVPVNPGNASWLVALELDPGFAGPEVQYLEYGAVTPAVIPREATAPVFTVEITLKDVRPGDRFEFHLLDFVTVWSGGEHGAFSTRGPGVTIDTGGDVVPDGTRTIYGVDPDPALPVPPATFLVDYIDGPPGGGPAVIEVIPEPGDVDGSGVVDVADLLLVLAAWGPYEPCPPYAPEDLDRDCDVGFADLLIVLAAWGPCEDAS